MPYETNGKCIHVYKQIGRHEEGKVFRCDTCGEIVRAKENKPRFNNSMQYLGDRQGGDDEEETSIGVGDKKTPPGDTEAI